MGWLWETVAGPFLLGRVFWSVGRARGVLVVGQGVERGRGAALLLGGGVGGGRVGAEWSDGGRRSGV
jgi:hypothetical protein